VRVGVVGWGVGGGVGGGGWGVGVRWSSGDEWRSVGAVPCAV